jgi:protein-tyrosine sulfotransferase
MSEGKPSYEGIVVLGVPRSGTTLMRRLLNAHPNICCPPETNLLSAASRFLQEERILAGISVGVLPGLSYSGFTDDEVMDRLRGFVLSFFHDITKKAGKRIWAEKTAYDVFHIEAINQLLGDRVRYICIFRHGLDVTCSTKELCDAMDRYFPELHSYIQKYSSPLEAFARAWADSSQILDQFHKDNKDLCFALHYEDLVKDPDTILNALFYFLEQPFDIAELCQRAFKTTPEIGLGDWKAYTKHAFDRSAIGRWKKLPPSAIAILSDIVNPTLHQLGYDEVRRPPAVSAEAARFHYAAQLIMAQQKSTGDKPGQ